MALLIDLDGVIYQGDQPVVGARDALAWADRRHLTRVFLSNTTSRPRSALVDKLAGFGIQSDPERILTPAVAAVRWLADRQFGRIALFIPEATAREFSAFSVQAADDEGPVDAVVVGDLGSGWTFAVLNRAFRLLMRDPPPKLLALGMTRYWQAPDGLRLDTAPFVVALAHASGVQPVVLGKPAVPFFQAALSLAGASARETVMIGDDIRADIGGAQAAGIRTLLVRTGKFRPDDLDGDIRPDGVLDSIADLPAWWDNNHG